MPHELTIRARRSVAAAVIAAAALAGSSSAQEAAAGAPASADTLLLSVEEVQRLALAQNPAYLAEAQELPLARGELRQARVYAFNPHLELDAPGAASDGKLRAYEATLDQEVEWAGQRGLRIEAAETGVARAAFAVRNSARLTIAAATQAYYAALAARERLEVANQVLTLNERLLAVVRIQVREGEISRMEANLADIEVGRARARVLATQREAVAAELELKRQVGLRPQQPVRLARPQPVSQAESAQPLDSLVAQALPRRPDIAARAAAAEQAAALTRLARREAIPNLTIGALLRREMPEAEPRVGIRAALPLPFWNRNQGLIAQRQAAARRALLEHAAAEFEVRTAVATAYYDHLSAAREVQVYEQDVLRPARENQRLLESAFAAGKVGLPTLLLLRNQLLDAELGFWQAWLTERRAAVSLQAATGAIGATEHSNGDDR